MDLQELLTRDGDQIVAEASAALTRSQLAHYAEAGHAVGQERLARLFQLTTEGIADRNLVPVMEYMAEVAVVAKNADKIYKYMNFDQIEEYAETAKGVTA